MAGIGEVNFSNWDEVVDMLTSAGINLYNPFDEKQNAESERSKRIARKTLRDEKLDKVVEIFRNLNLKYDFTDRTEVPDDNFWNRTSPLMAEMSEKTVCDTEEKYEEDREIRIKAYKRVMYGESEAEQKERKRIEKRAEEKYWTRFEQEKQDILNNVMSETELNRRKGKLYTETEKAQMIKDLENTYNFLIKLDVEYYMGAPDNKNIFGKEYRRASRIKKAYEYVMEHGNAVDKEQASMMFGLYCSIYDENRKMDLEAVNVVPVRENEYCASARGHRQLKNTYDLKIPESWITTKENTKDGSKFDVVKFPADFVSGSLNNKYSFSLGQENYQGTENGMRVYALPTFSQISMRKTVGKNSMSGKWQYDYMKIAPSFLDEIIEKYNAKKEQEKTVEAREQEPDYSSYDFGR